MCVVGGCVLCVSVHVLLCVLCSLCVCVCLCVPGGVVILDTVRGGEQPVPAQDGGPAHVTFAPYVETHLPGPLPDLRNLPPHHSRALEGTGPTLCTHTHN